MIGGFFSIVIFLFGFFLGVFERKVDRLKIKNPLAINYVSADSEVLITPSDEEQEKQQAKTFYDAIK